LRFLCANGRIIKPFNAPQFHDFVRQIVAKFGLGENQFRP
jgi:hypothetical protein